MQNMPKMRLLVAVITPPYVPPAQRNITQLGDIPCHKEHDCRCAKNKPNPTFPRQVARQRPANHGDVQLRDAEIDDKWQRRHPKSVVANRLRPVAAQQFMGCPRDSATGTLKPCHRVKGAKRNVNAGRIEPSKQPKHQDNN